MDINHIMRKLYLPLFLWFILGFSSCSFQDSNPITDTKRGRIIQSSLTEQYSRTQVDSILTDLDPFIGQLLTPKYGIKLYKVVYETIDWKGRPIIASGALAVPNPDSAFAYPLTSYQHGTVLHKTGVPSQGSGDRMVGVINAADGYVVAMPDYIGLGEGEGFPGYTHSKTEATAVIDMLRASRNVCAAEEISLTEELYLFGYSQGGHATMAAHKMLQEKHWGEFIVTASAPMAGPYDVSGVQAEVMVSDSSYPTPGYLPFILYSYNMIYEMYDDVNIVFRSPYDTLLPGWMDQSNSIGYINNQIPNVPKLILKDSVVQSYLDNANHPLRHALRDNNLYDWKPRCPVRLYHCPMDDQVSYENSVVAYNKFKENGVQSVKIIQPNAVMNHGDCALPTLLMAKVWFDSLHAGLL